MPGGQQAARFVWIIMPGERVVWIPPERLCTGTKRMEEELCHSRDQGGSGGGEIGRKKGGVSCYMGEVELRKAAFIMSLRWNLLKCPLCLFQVNLMPKISSS